ncbi:MAG: hypothetical protein K2W82_04350 [Candidatus Obscuribacterales bacterium]|nr:hypothetical protein [Candidatus Obscuribacterales bacterium]
MTNHTKWLLSCGIVSVLSAVSSAQAQPAATAVTTNAAQTLAISKTEEQQLRRIGEAMKRTKRAADDMVMECTQPVEMLGEIDIIGTDVIPIMPATAEGFGTDYMPPRPKYVNLHMQQLAGMIPILQDEISTLTIPDQEKEFAAPHLQDLNLRMDKIRQSFNNLQALCASVPYDRSQMASESQNIDTQIKTMDQTRKKLLHEDLQVEKQEKKAVSGN